MKILTSNYENLPNIPKDYILVSISEKINKNIQDKIHIWDNRLAPTWDMYQEYKYSGNVEQYKEQLLNERLSILDLDSILLEWIATYGKDKTFVLLCYESTNKFCHRYLVREELCRISKEKTNNFPV